MKTSVALCTYNGNRYIVEQLKSILNQTIIVDEIIICDDCSTDTTVSTIQNFIKNNSQIHTKIQLHINENQLGVCTNFQRALNLCTGDVFFLSDQDDIWYPNKVEIILDWFKKNPSKDTVFTNATLINDENIRFTSDTLFQSVGYEKEERSYFDSKNELLLFKNHNVATGATMATKAKYEFASYCIAPNIIHDYMIAVMAAQQHRLGYLEIPTIHYRIHKHQVCGIPTIKPLYSDTSAIKSPLKSHRGFELSWNFPLSTTASKYILFQDKRADFIKHRYGWILATCCFVKYILLYHQKWFTLLKYDIRQSVLNSNPPSTCNKIL